VTTSGLDSENRVPCSSRVNQQPPIADSPDTGVRPSSAANEQLEKEFDEQLEKVSQGICIICGKLKEIHTHLNGNKELRLCPVRRRVYENP
jgi:hypothetical protein